MCGLGCKVQGICAVDVYLSVSFSVQIVRGLGCSVKGISAVSVRLSVLVFKWCVVLAVVLKELVQ